MRRHARQRRTLGLIERALESGHPELAGKFAVFTRLTAGEEPAGIERIDRRQTGIQRIARGEDRRPAAVLALLAVVTLALLVSGVVLGTSASGAATTCGARTYGLGYIASESVTVRGDALRCGRPGGRVQCRPRISGTKPQSC
jgi:hypothetical protein